MPNDPATPEWWRTAHKTHAERIKEKQSLADALAEQRQRSEDAWDTATAKMRLAWIAGRDE